MSPRTSGFRRKSQIHCFLIHFSKFRREFRTLRNSRNRRNRQKNSSEKQGSLDFAFFHESRNSSLLIGNPMGVKESRSQKKKLRKIMGRPSAAPKGGGRLRRPPPLCCHVCVLFLHLRVWDCVIVVCLVCFVCCAPSLRSACLWTCVSLGWGGGHEIIRNPTKSDEIR